MPPGHLRAATPGTLTPHQNPIETHTRSDSTVKPHPVSYTIVNHAPIPSVKCPWESIQYVCTVGGAERIIASVTIAAAREVPLETGAEIRISWRIEDCLLIEDASRLEGHGR